MRISRSGIFLTRDPGWKNSDLGPGINIPDPQHCRKDFHISRSRSTNQSPYPVFRIWDVYPRSWSPIFIHPAFRIPDHGLLDPRSNNKREGGKIIVVPFHKIVNYFISNRYRYRKKVEQIAKNFSIFTHKIVTKLSEIQVGDPGSASLTTHTAPYVARLKN
jgi:hypothetical protein